MNTQSQELYKFAGGIFFRGQHFVDSESFQYRLMHRIYSPGKDMLHFLLFQQSDHPYRSPEIFSDSDNHHIDLSEWQSFQSQFIRCIQHKSRGNLVFQIIHPPFVLIDTDDFVSDGHQLLGQTSSVISQTNDYIFHMYIMLIRQLSCLVDDQIIIRVFIFGMLLRRYESQYDRNDSHTPDKHQQGYE